MLEARYPPMPDASPQGSPSLASDLQTPDPAGLRREGTRNVGATGGPRVHMRLARALRDPDVVVRREAVGALGRLGEIETLPLIVQALRDTDEEVREMAREALMSLSGKHGCGR